MMCHLENVMNLSKKLNSENLLNLSWERIRLRKFYFYWTKTLNNCSTKKSKSKQCQELPASCAHTRENVSNESFRCPLTVLRIKKKCARSLVSEYLIVLAAGNSLRWLSGLQFCIDTGQLCIIFRFHLEIWRYLQVSWLWIQKLVRIRNSESGSIKITVFCFFTMVCG